MRRLGRVDYDAAWALQREAARDAAAGRGVLFLLEHPPVFTLGKNGDLSNILDPHGIPVQRIDRGGDVTYHGPGQLVGYPVLLIRRGGVRRFVRHLEEFLVRLAGECGVKAWWREGTVGVWASRGKIASIGLRVSRGVSTHGFAINVENDLAPFGYINPCGERGGAVSSLSLELGRRIPLEEAVARAAALWTAP